MIDWVGPAALGQRALLEHVAEPILPHLPLDDGLVYRARGEEAVHVARSRLPAPMATCRGLSVNCKVVGWGEQDGMVADAMQAQMGLQREVPLVPHAHRVQSWTDTPCATKLKIMSSYKVKNNVTPRCISCGEPEGRLHAGAREGGGRTGAGTAAPIGGSW